MFKIINNPIHCNHRRVPVAVGAVMVVMDVGVLVVAIHVV
jgi:hypothetical protein